MHSKAVKGQIRPKISTMPRQQSAAADYLNIYKLEIEKQRLQQELQTLEQRRHQIDERLSLINTQISKLETSVDQQRDTQPVGQQAIAVKPAVRSIVQSTTSDSLTFETLFLDY